MECNTIKDKEKHSAGIAVAVLLAVAALAGALSMYIVWYGDAFRYQFNFATGEPLRDIAEIPVSQYSHFLNINGRIVAHAIVQLFCGILGQKVFAACNAAAYVCLILLLIRYAGGDWRDRRFTLAASLLTLFFCDTSYIPPHQIGYVWMSCTALAFLIEYGREDKHGRPGWATCAGLFLFGLICGNGNEAIDLGIGAALGIDMLRRWRTCGLRRKILLAGFCAGVALLCLTPGQIGNAASSYRPGPVVSLFNLVTSLRGFWVFAVLFAVALIRHRIRLRDFVSENRLMFMAMAVMIVFNVAITVKGNRQLFGVELYSAVLSLRLLSRFRISPAWLAAGMAVVAAQYYMKFVTLSEFNSDEKELRRQLTEHGNTHLYIDLNHHNPYVHPIEELSYHDCVNLTFHVATCADDIYGYGSFVTGSTGHIDSVGLYPKVLAEIEKLMPRNRVVLCGNGVYMLLRSKSDPARFILHRSLDVPFLDIPLPPVEVPFGASQHPSTDTYDVYVSTFPYPLMRADSVTME